jgi:hypothetical protein
MLPEEVPLWTKTNCTHAAYVHSEETPSRQGYRLVAGELHRRADAFGGTMEDSAPGA